MSANPGWVGTLPQPGPRWQEEFLEACTRPGAFDNVIHDRNGYVGIIRSWAEELRSQQPTDDDALLDALLGIVDRDERPGAQREALAWIDGLGLGLDVRPERLIRLAGMADSQVARRFVDVLFTLDLADDDLERLGLATLTRREKGLKRDVLTHLRRLTHPSTELMELVGELARGSDTTTATLASTLCESWGVAAAPAATVGLWRDPVRPEPIPLVDAAEAVLDEPGLTALLGEVASDWTETDPDLAERVLAHLVATAHAHGPEPVVAACRAARLAHPFLFGCLPPLLRALGEGVIVPGETPPRLRSPEGPLEFLAAQRIHDVLHRLGELPCLLSTPSTSHYGITADDFRTRVARCDEAGVAVEPSDVAVALARLSPDADLTGCDAAIRGCDLRLADLIRSSVSPEPPQFTLTPQEGVHEDVLRVVGDEPACHDALGLLTAWNHRPYRPDVTPLRSRVADLPMVWPEDKGAGVSSGHVPVAFRLLPRHLTRPVAMSLHLVRWNEHAPARDAVLDCATVAQRFDEPLVVAILAVCSHGPAKDRDVLAAALLDAWERGGLTPDDLLAGWRSALWEQLNPMGTRSVLLPAPPRIAALLALIAEAGGLALAWPLLVEIAETLAAQEKIPTTASTVLETLLALLPEVPHPVELPNIRALAGRKGKSKAITTARAIGELL